jgi:hypothetical protein
MDPQPPDEQTPHDPDIGVPPPPAGMPPPSHRVTSGPPRRPGRTIIAMVVAAALVLGGGAAATAFLLMRGSSDRIVHMIPATSDLVMTAYLDPAASQKVNLLALAEKFPALSDNGGVAGGVNDMLDELLKESGLTHRDVLPWLGSQFSAVVEFNPDDLDPAVAVLIETDDEEAAGRAISTLTESESLQTHDYKGVETHVGDDGSWAIVDGVVVLVDDPTFLTTIIDTSQGDTSAIADDARYVSTIAALPESKLGYIYVNPTHFIDQFTSMAEGLGMEGSSAPGFQQLSAWRSVGVSLSAEPDGLAVDFTVRFDPSKLDAGTKALLDAPVHDNAMLSFVPADSYAVFAQENVDLSLQQAMDQFTAAAPAGLDIPSRFGVDETLASLTGDVAFEVSPGAEGPIGAAVLLGVDETGPAQKTLDEIAQAIVPLLQSSYGTASSGTAASASTEDLPLGLGLNHRFIRWRSTSYQGTTIKYLEDSDLASTGLAPAYAVLDGAAVIATDPGEIKRLINVKNGGPSITSAPRYVEALGHVPAGGGAFLDVEAVVSAIREALPAEIQAAFDAQAGPNLAPVKAFVTGTENSSEGSTTRIFIVIE